MVLIVDNKISQGIYNFSKFDTIKVFYDYDETARIKLFSHSVKSLDVTLFVGNTSDVNNVYARICKAFKNDAECISIRGKEVEMF